MANALPGGPSHFLRSGISLVAGGHIQPEFTRSTPETLIQYLDEPDRLISGPGNRRPELLERYFALIPDDLANIGRRREDWTRLGFAIQLGTVRFLGTFVTRLEETRRR